MIHPRLWPAVGRRLVARRPWIYWVALAIAVAGTVVAARRQVDGVETARAAWGERADVLVAAADAAPGDPLLLDVRQVPRAVVPESALDASTGAGTLVARHHLGEGEIVTAHDVGRERTSGPAALVPDGWLVVPVVESPPSGAEVGSAVHLVSGGIEVTGAALIVGHHADATLVAVPPEVAPLIPAAAQTDGVTVLLAP